MNSITLSARCGGLTSGIRAKAKEGEQREAWVVDYTDQAGERHIETFARKKDADARQADVKVAVKKGIHVAASNSVTVAEATARWIESAEVELERATAKTYREHVKLHIVPFIGRVRLSEMSVPMVSKFRDELRKAGRSPALVRKILVSLGSLIADAQDHGLVAYKAVASFDATGSGARIVRPRCGRRASFRSA